MSLDLLKERFGGTKPTDKKESDKQKLNEMFVSNPMGNLESFKSQHQGELEEKDRIIENLLVSHNFMQVLFVWWLLLDCIYLLLKQKPD